MLGLFAVCDAARRGAWEERCTRARWERASRTPAGSAGLSRERDSQSRPFDHGQARNCGENSIQPLAVRPIPLFVFDSVR